MVSGRAMIRSVVHGQDPEKVIHGALSSLQEAQASAPAAEPPAPEVVYQCTNKTGCKYEKKSSPLPKTCPECGAAVVRVEREIVGDPVSEDPVVQSSAKVFIKTDVEKPIRQYTFGALRPGDRFVFLSTLPTGARPDVEYTVIPARRGFVTCTDEFNRTITMPLCHGLLCDVKLLSQELPDPDKRFVVGDNVRCIGTNRRGVVTGVKGTGYFVKFEDDSEQKKVWVSSNYLQLINKNKTTRSYITQENDGSKKWVVSFGDFREVCDDFHGALRLLCETNRPAFNRYSKMLVNKVGSLSTEDIEVLITLDPRLWGKFDILAKHGYLKTKEEYEDVRKKFNI